jgi:hypothetical protein
LRRPSLGVLHDLGLGEGPGLAERLHQRQHACVADPPPHPRHQRGVVDPVEARLDVTFQDQA